MRRVTKAPHPHPSPLLKVYDDLGTPQAPRPPLGGSAQLPYPRHLANSRAESAQGPGKPWLMFGQSCGARTRRGGDGGGSGHRVQRRASTPVQTPVNGSCRPCILSMPSLECRHAYAPLPPSPRSSPDEMFDSTKRQGFNGGLLKSVAPAVAQGVRVGAAGHAAASWGGDVLRLLPPRAALAAMSKQDALCVVNTRRRCPASSRALTTC